MAESEKAPSEHDRPATLAVWAGEDTDDNVVAVYVGYLRAKLDGDGAPRLIQTVRGFGYSLREA